MEVSLCLIKFNMEGNVICHFQHVMTQHDTEFHTLTVGFILLDYIYVHLSQFLGTSWVVAKYCSISQTSAFKIPISSFLYSRPLKSVCYKYLDINFEVVRK